MQLIDGLPEKIPLEHTCGTGKGPQSAWAFRAAQITGCRGLKGNGNRVTPLHRLSGPLADLVTGQHFQPVPHPPEG